MPTTSKPTHKFNIWDHEENFKEDVTISCLLPTGILVLLRCKREETITNIKSKVWKEAKNFPFFNSLLGINFYIFQCINQSAEQEDLLYEGRRLCDVKPFTPDLRLVPRSDDVESKVLMTKIGILIDKSLHEFDMMKVDEVNDFRVNNAHTGVSLQRERAQWTWEQKANFLFPPQVELSLDLSQNLKQKLEERQRFVCDIRFNDDLLETYEIAADPYELPIDLVNETIRRYRQSHGMKAEDYVLKVPGREEFLLGDRPLHQYKYIRDIYSMIKGDRRPGLILIHRGELRVNEKLMDPLLRKLSSDVQPPAVPAKQGTQFTSDIHEKVRITINRAWNVNVDNTGNPLIRVRAGIYHGGEQLHETFISTTEAAGSNPEWNDFFEANLTVNNLPRMARLCLLLCSQTNRKAKKESKKELVPLAWANITFFDYKNQLRMGSQEVVMWPALEDADLNPMGTVESNLDRSRDATRIRVTFGTYANSTISYPSFDKILEKAAEVYGRDGEEEEDTDAWDYTDFTRLEDVRKLLEKDPLDELDMMEKEKLWKERTDCRDHIPTSLPRILQCVQWDNCECVAQMQALLQIWPQLKPEEAMALLDYKYPDITVRQYAVKCLEQLTDSDLSQYLLQLVQALKYETHLDSDLGRFLLRRSLSNQRIGHFFFWHLRAEMHNPAVSTRFGLLLEAYCRGNIAHMKILEKQVVRLSQMKQISEMIKKADSVTEHEFQALMANLQPESSSSPEGVSEELALISPLSPSYRLGSLRIEECKFMKSKMRPLWLVFKNGDPAGNDVLIMYKHGDDLRQDMLTLQVMQIMDNIWKNEGLDLRLIPYKALATGGKSGLIEIVTNARTIANIQLSRGNGKLNAAFQKSSIFEWIKENNTTSKELDRAIEDFTYSCAGYCVATYILGIGDRHNDNIMVKKTGQMFHIDFGHFLGNFKSKWGVRRERVPFVLTHDFVHVITRGRTTTHARDFNKFRTCCEDAFMTLRRHGNLLITLFSMMLSSGIPELSDSTILYLRESLVLAKDDEDARKHFKAKFKEALRNSWKTSVNWMAHHLAH